ncbi:MAG: hypothetical protein ACOX9C_05230 [Kiritimatiellia bacterium]|jgi:beta-galactosidase
MTATLLAGLMGVATLELGDNLTWENQKVETPFETPKAENWTASDWRKMEGQKTEAGGTWKRTSFVVPADWDGLFVRFEQLPLQRVDIGVFLNGEKAGEILRPGGDVEVSKFLKPGATNELALYYTVSGQGTEHGEWTIGEWFQHYMGPRPMAPARLIASKGPQIVDVFANTSARKRRIDFEVSITASERFDGSAGSVLRVDVLDAATNVVKTLSRKIRLQPGENTFTLGESWDDPTCWELGVPYLYTAHVTLGPDGAPDAAADATQHARSHIRFGFREIWRDGKDLWMNGHKVRLRTCFAYNRADKLGAKFLQDIGYNVLTYNHNTDAFPIFPSDETLSFYDEEGIGVFCAAGNFGNVAGYDFNKDEAAAEQYRKYQRLFHRMTRNHPSLIACYTTQMIICDIGFSPNAIAQKPGTAHRDELINLSRELNRVWNPNILYYSHADGANGDMSSGNIYLNWTPLQEREEWFSQWKRKGLFPWHGAEVGQPYMGCWYDRNRIYVGNERLTQYFGDAVYAAEREDDLRRNLDAGATMPNAHGSETGHFIVQQHPFYQALERLFVWRSNSRWRADGMNGGSLWFNRQGYGSERCGMYGENNLELSKPTHGRKPDWASPAYDAYQLGNRDFCGYIGGTPEHYDKTHAYYAGETIAKQAVFLWDSARPASFTCKATFNGETKTATVDVPPGETRFAPFNFTAPQVKAKTSCELTMTFTQNADGKSGTEAKEWFTDTLAIEVYPKTPRGAKVEFAGKVALFDPDGASENVLKALGIDYKKITGPEQVTDDVAALVIGKNGADRMPLTSFATRLATDNFAIVVLPQTADTWRALGLRPMDTMSRILFLRDRDNAAFAGVSDDMLQYWRGAPRYGNRDFGPVMTHTKQRGPRWTRNHVVAGLTLEIPAAIGYRSLVDGEYDMNYAGVLEFLAGTGKITYCTLDFENRMDVDPAATAVAQAVFAQALKTETLPRNIVLVENDAEKAKALGFTVSEPTSVWRVPAPKGAPFRGIGPGLWRWTDRLEARLLSNPPAGFTISAGGLVAEGERNGRRHVLVMVPREQLAARYKKDPETLQPLADIYADYLKTMSHQALVALGAAPEGVKAPRFRETDVRYRARKYEWYDLSARHLVEKFSATSHGDDAGAIRIIGGSRLWPNSGHAVRWNDKHQAALESGENFFLTNPNDDICKAFGFETEYTCVTTIPATAIGALDVPALDLSALEGLTMRVLTNAPDGFTLSPGGFYAHGKIGESEIYVEMMEVDLVERALKAYPHRNRSCVYAEEHVDRLYARLRTNAGVRPDGQHVKRALYQSGVAPFQPLPAVYVLGPFATGQDNDGTINTVWSEQGEKMAIAGDFNPNIEFPLPQGGTCNWRPTLAPDADGLFDFRTLGGAFENASFPCTYAIAIVNREAPGEAILKFGVDWRARIWVNGEEAFATAMGAQYPKFQIKLDLKAGDNVIAFKIGAGRAGNKFWGLLENESIGADRQLQDPELDALTLYPERVTPVFDPYEFSFW